MSRVCLLHVDGLDEELLAGLPATRNAATRTARLELGFPALPDAVAATLRSGQTPAVHGILGEDAAALAPEWMREFAGTHGGDALRVTAEAEEARRFWHDAGDPALLVLRDRGLVATLLRGGTPDLAALDARVAAWLGADADLALVAGGPALSPVHRVVPLGPRLAELLDDGVTWRAESALARIEGGDPTALRDGLVGIAGVERVLGPSALHLLQATPAGSPVSFVVAEPGVSFTPGARGVGHLDPAASPVLLGAGSVGKWPRAVHDLRVAPTLAAALGRPLDGFADSPLA